MTAAPGNEEDALVDRDAGACRDGLLETEQDVAVLLECCGLQRLRRLRYKVLTWYAANGRDLPWRRTADPYAVLVSEVMLQQTQVPRVAPKYEGFLARFPTLEALAAAAPGDVLALWSGLGYNARAVRLQRAAQAAVAAAPEGRPATLPADLDALLRLPGVGPYTARAVMIFAHNADLAAVDANVRRVLTHELGLPPVLSPAALQLVADAALPKGRSRDWHNALMDYGSLVLTSRATGIQPLTRQGPFVGSRRWFRARTVKLLLEASPRSRAELTQELGLGLDELMSILDDLARDGLVELRDDGIALP